MGSLFGLASKSDLSLPSTWVAGMSYLAQQKSDFLCLLFLSVKGKN
jgi:hypothetical protein